MKKIIPIFLILTIISFGCEKTDPIPETTSAEPKQERTENLPNNIPTTGKIYAPTPEGIRPADATKPSSSTKVNTQMSSTKPIVRTPRDYSDYVSVVHIDDLAQNISQSSNYWYECDYFGNCWDSEGYVWNDCYYDSLAKSCEKGSYWNKTESQKQAEAKNCCDSWGTCYDENGESYEDSKYQTVGYCDECGNCYDYYGNYIGFDETSVDQQFCDQYYQYEKVHRWDACGNALDAQGNFLFYDNYYYDFVECYDDKTYCGDGFGGPDITENPQADYCDECGNCYDYYGEFLNYDASYHDEYWCSQYYQYDKVYKWDVCGNAFDAYENFLFYDNAHYDWRACNNEYSTTSV